jgi:hypothetical protein
MQSKETLAQYDLNIIIEFSSYCGFHKAYSELASRVKVACNNGTSL